MKNEKFCFSKGVGILSLVCIVLVAAVLLMRSLVNQSTSTNTRAFEQLTNTPTPYSGIFVEYKCGTKEPRLGPVTNPPFVCYNGVWVDQPISEGDCYGDNKKRNFLLVYYQQYKQTRLGKTLTEAKYLVVKDDAQNRYNYRSYMINNCTSYEIAYYRAVKAAVNDKKSYPSARVYGPDGEFN